MSVVCAGPPRELDDRGQKHSRRRARWDGAAARVVRRAVGTIQWTAPRSEQSEGRPKAHRSRGRGGRTFHDVGRPPGGAMEKGGLLIPLGEWLQSLVCHLNHNSISDGGNSIFVSDDHHRRHSKRMGGRWRGGREWREVGGERRDEAQHRVLSNHRTQSFLDASNKTLPI